MSRRGSIILRFFAGLLLVGLLLAAGTMIFRAGVAQGYAISGTAATGESAQAILVEPYYPIVFRPHYGFFSIIPMFGLLLFGFFLFIIIGSLLRFAIFGPRRWGPPARHWHKYHPDWGAHPWSNEAPQDSPTSEEEKSEESQV